MLPDSSGQGIGIVDESDFFIWLTLFIYTSPTRSDGLEAILKVVRSFSLMNGSIFILGL